MAKFRKGTGLICVPCGRQVVISSEGVAATTIWCCGKPMRSGAKTGTSCNTSMCKPAKKKAAKKPVRKKTVRKKK